MKFNATELELIKDVIKNKENKAQELKKFFTYFANQEDSESIIKEISENILDEISKCNSDELNEFLNNTDFDQILRKEGVFEWD